MKSTILSLIGAMLLAVSFGAFAQSEQENFGYHYEFENESNGVLAMKKMYVGDLCHSPQLFYCKISTSAPVGAYYSRMTSCQIIPPMETRVRALGQIKSGSTSGLSNCTSGWSRYYP